MYSRILRFAPSPNGYLHLGHAYSALLNHDMARELGGRLVLRIEDIDAERCRPHYEQAIYEDLRWLGISWAEPVRRQSEHFDDYAAAIAELEAQGLIYPSFESRSELNALVAELDLRGRWPRDPDGVPIYPGRARKLSAAERKRRRDAGEPFALRLAVDAAVARAGALSWTETGAGPHGQTGHVIAAPQMWGDVVLARKETPTSYHLAVVLDDALQGVSRRRARAGFILVDRHSSAVAGAARAAGADLPSSQAHYRRRGPQAVEIDQSDGVARIARRGIKRGRYPAPGRAGAVGRSKGDGREVSKKLSVGDRLASLLCSGRRRGMLGGAPRGFHGAGQI